MALVAESKVAKRYGVCTRTLTRWDENRERAQDARRERAQTEGAAQQPELDPSAVWPSAVWINGRKYRPDDLLDEFDAAVVRAAMMERHNENRATRARSASEAASKARQLKRQLAAQSTAEAG
jgi:hypothetical protein